ncbi:putative glutamate receptor [Tachypleus tridentatus]|uniref:putative glutamate receptor n=1 Tax=Tachypleus tridentatus TaxID=6853 RepID=UPI003FCF0AA2
MLLTQYRCLSVFLICTTVIVRGEDERPIEAAHLWKEFLVEVAGVELKWKSLILVHDDSIEQRWSLDRLIQDLSRHHVSTTLYKITLVALTKEVERLLDIQMLVTSLESLVERISPIQVVVAPSWALMDMLINKVTRSSLLLGPNTRWILLLENEDKLLHVCNYVNRDNNILLMTLPKVGEDSLNVFKIKYNPLSRNTTLQRLDKWYYRRRHKTNKTYFRNFQANPSLQGRVLKVALERHFPFFLPAEETELQQPIGVDIEILNVLQKLFNITYEIHRPPDGKWGSLINGTWNGMIGMIHRQEVDLAMGGMTISLARRQVVDFSPAYCFDRTTFVTRAPSENSKAWVIVFPFQWTVWLAITLAVFTVAFNLLMSENCFHLYTFAQGIREDEEKKSNDKFVYLKAVVLLLKGIVAQDSYVPNTHPGRFLMATWWIFVVTIITAYSGTLTSFMANPGTQESLDTIDKLVDKIKAGTFSCGVIKDSSDHNLFKNPQSEAFAVILNNMESRPENFVTSDKEGLAKCFKENYAYLGGHLTVDADIQHIQSFSSQETISKFLVTE